MAWTFKLPQGDGKKKVDAQSITIREVTGADEEVAAQWAEAKGKRGSIPVELLRISIVKVNGVPAPVPFGEFDTWNARTRRFALRAFNEINGISTDEDEDFISGGVEESDASTAAASFVSG